MTAMSPDQIAAKWAQNLQAAGPSITAGVQAVTVAPGQAAARQKQVWTQNTTAAADKWARNTAAVPLETWKADMLNKGVARIGQGAQAAQPKMVSFMSKLLPYQQTLKQQLPPRGNLQQNLARMTQFVQGMAQFNK